MSWKVSRQDYLNFFRVADENKDGFISMKELRTTLREFGYKGSDSDINVMFHTSDTNGDNLISLSEFWVAMGQFVSRKHVLDVFVRVFRRNDDNRDGVVTALEFKKSMADLEPYLTKDEHQRLDDMIPKKDRKGFEYLNFKPVISAVWEDMDRYDEFWFRADADHDGQLTRKELIAALIAEGYSKKDIEKKLDNVSKSGSDKISYEQYIEVMSEMPGHAHKSAYLRKVFESFDTDRSGTINKRELQAACTDLGKAFSDRQIKQIMDQADKDGSGELEYDEFVASIEDILAQEDAYQKFFRDADEDESGYLTVSELIKALRNGGYKGTDDQIKRMFHATDFSADRKISFDEYMVCMGRNPPGDFKQVLDNLTKSQ